MTSKQNLLIIGSGGREHALAWKISQSPSLGKLYVAPGNSGTASLATNVPIPAVDTTALVDFAKKHHIDLTLVGPDDALATGLVDAFAAAGLRAFGPTKAAARIESSKAFSKDLMTEQNIPTARYETFTNQKDAQKYLDTQSFPLVIKASGLALGKGVYICTSADEATQALADIMGEKIFGESGSSVVIEEFLEGQEISVHAFSDGQTSVMFPTSQDHKRILAGDQGPNTGGMGSFAPVPWTTPDLLEQVHKHIVAPALTGLADAGAPFVGVLYPGLMVGDPTTKVLEYNARFGDPETQVYMRLLDTDLVDILNTCLDGTLAQTDITWSHKTAVCVVLASPGYPGQTTTGLTITGVEEAEKQPGIVVFHAGAKRSGEELVTSGGRVLGVTAIGTDLADAQAKAYAAVKLIHFEGMQYRIDIGAKAL